MATNIFANVTQRGTESQFRNELALIPQVWPNHTKEIASDAPDENHVWLGMAPVPREFVSGRSFKGMRDFTFVLTNKEYELSAIFDQNTMEDDRHSLIPQRVSEMAGVWGTYKDSLFTTLLEDGNGTNQGNAFDGVTFFNATRTIGDSGTINNIDTPTAATTTAPTVGEAKDALNAAFILFSGYNDDQGRSGYTSRAMSTMRIICDPQYKRVMTEVNDSSLISGGDDNPFFKGMLTSIDVLPYLTNATVQSYWTITGDPNRQPFIYQERTPLQVVVFNSDEAVADNHGLKVLVRQRFRLGYGEPRFAIEATWTV